jgi:hypothetical protein
VAFYLDVPVEIAEARIADRVVCDECRYPFARTDVDLGQACVRAACGGVVIRRPDDDEPPELRHREHIDSLRLRRYYADSGRLVDLPAGSSPDEVHNLAMQTLAAWDRR